VKFTFSRYRELLNDLKSAFKFGSFSKFEKEKVLYLRHDVDIFHENIIKFMDIEKSVGAKSIFFFQPNSSFYNLLAQKMKKLINFITDSGFEIGLHIDAANHNTISDIIEETRNFFDFYSNYFKLSNIISFHRPSKNVLRNIKIPGFINTYEDRFFKEIRYFSDSNRRCFLDQMKESINKDNKTSIQLLIHPYWWDFEHLDIQGLSTRLEIVRINNLRLALADETRLYRHYFSGRLT